MSGFVNTIVLLGDNAVMDAIFEGTLTEFKDNTLTHLSNTMISFESLTEVDLPALIDASGYAFLWSKSLTKVSVWSVNGFSKEKFTYANIRTLIVRRTDAVESLGGAYMNSSVYIYVPAALIDSYKAATNWSTYADRFRALEDYTVDGTTTGELDETKI